MKTARTVLLALASVALVTAIVVGLATYYMVHRPLPKQEGELAAAGAQDAITIYRDTWGVPQIYAATPYDLFFAQGFVHAQDRWLQMDVNRHLGHGTLSELLGQDDTVQAIDRLVRALGWDALAEADWAAAPAASRAVLEAYAAGVNSYIAQRDPGELALEYTVLDLTSDTVQIASWTPQDTLAAWIALNWRLTGSAAREIENAQALTRIDPAMLALYAPSAPAADAPTILSAADLNLPADSAAPPPAAAPAPLDYSRLPLDSALAALDLIGPREMPEGTAWAVAGQRTASGKPLLAVAPGQTLQMPSPWYEVGLYCIETSARCPYNVTGLSVPGMPAVVMGHNSDIAWGATSAWIDEQDVYIIRLNPQNPAQYAWEGGWRALDVRRASIPIRGEADPLEVTLYTTALGPLIAAPSPLLGRDEALVLHWTGLDAPADPVGCLLQLNRAADWESFRAALRLWSGPASNLLYADTQGNIGYQLAGRVPIRAEGHRGELPFPAADSRAAWRGLLPFEDLPAVLNPAGGVLIAANNPIAPASLDRAIAARVAGAAGFHLGAAWDPGDRAALIAARLRDSDIHTVETLAGIQGDTESLLAARIMPYLLRLPVDDAPLADMLEWLGEWDFRYTIDSPQAALFGAFWLRLIEFTYGDELGILPCDCAATAQGLSDLLPLADQAWWDDVQTRFVTEQRDAILRKALEQAVIDVTDRLGPNRDQWHWGDLHSATFTSVLALNPGVRFIEDQFNRGPVAVSGSGETINATRSAARGSLGTAVLTAPSARLIIDLGDLENSRAIHTTGQSSHLASPHFDDMIDPWRFIEYHTVLWNHATIEETADAMLSLEPVYGREETAPAP